MFLWTFLSRRSRKSSPILLYYCSKHTYTHSLSLDIYIIYIYIYIYIYIHTHTHTQVETILNIRVAITNTGVAGGGNEYNFQRPKSGKKGSHTIWCILNVHMILHYTVKKVWNCSVFSNSIYNEHEHNASKVTKQHGVTIHNTKSEKSPPWKSGNMWTFLCSRTVEITSVGIVIEEACDETSVLLQIASKVA